MADFTAKSALGTNTVKSSGQDNLSLTVAAAVAVGDVVIVLFGTDSEGSDSTHDSFLDSAGNSWTKIGQATNSGDCTISMWMSHITAALGSGVGTLTPHIAAAEVAKAITAHSFTIPAGYTVQRASAPGTGTGSGSYSATETDAESKEYLVIGGVVLENALTPVVDTDFTQFGGANTTGNPGASNIGVNAGYRIVTTTSETFNGTISGEGASMCAFIELIALTPTITDVEGDEDVTDGDTGVTATGTKFGASQGTGKLELASSSDYATATKVQQTITSWADTAIDFTVGLGALSPGTVYVFVTNGTGGRSAGFPINVNAGGDALVEVVSENLDTAEAKNYVRGRARGNLDDIGIAEATNRTRGLGRIIGEALGLSEARSRIMAFVRVVTEPLGLAEAPARYRARYRLVTDALGLTEAAPFVRGVFRIVTEPIALTENAVHYVAGALVRVIVEALDIADAQSYVRGRARGTVDNISMLESSSRHLAIVRLLTEALGVTEAVARFRARRRGVVENVGITEATARYRGRHRLATETIGLTEAAARYRARKRSVLEPVDFTEGALPVRVLVRIVTEAIAIAEAVIHVLSAVAGTLIRVVGESVAVAETHIRALGIARVVNEAAALGEAISRHRSLVRAKLDAIGLSESMARARALVRSALEAIGVPELARRLRGRIRRILEALGLAEVPSSIARTGYDRLVARDISGPTYATRTAVTATFRARLSLNPTYQARDDSRATHQARDESRPTFQRRLA